MATLSSRIILIAFLVCFCKCSNNQNKVVPSLDSINNRENEFWPDSNSSFYRKDSLGKMFYNTMPFEILSFKKGVTLEYTDPDDTTECKKWKIERENLHTIFKNSEPISGTTWDLTFVFTTCVVTGQIRQNDGIFDYSINAGSWFRVTCRDTSLLFGDFNNNDEVFFLYDADTN